MIRQLEFGIWDRFWWFNVGESGEMLKKVLEWSHTCTFNLKLWVTGTRVHQIPRVFFLNLILLFKIFIYFLRKAGLTMSITSLKLHTNIFSNLDGFMAKSHPILQLLQFRFSTSAPPPPLSLLDIIPSSGTC